MGYAKIMVSILPLDLPQMDIYLHTPELFQSLLKINHVSYQITLDGDEEWHDKTRVLANRKPTFTKIWNNLLSYRSVSEKFYITLRLHVHQENIESVKRLYKKVRENFSDDPRFTIYFHKVSNLNPSYEIGENVLDSVSYKNALDYILEDSYISQNTPISEEHLSDYICYAAKPNSLMVRANGGLGKCTVALGDDRNNIGKINEDGTIEISNSKLQKWFAGFSDLSEEILGCPLHTLQRN